MLNKNNGNAEQEYYLNPAAYLIDEFEKIHLLLLHAVRLFRITNPPQTGPFNGFFISDPEIDLILEKSKRASGSADDVENRRQMVNKLEERIAGKLRRCEVNGVMLPITRLRNGLGLSDYEVNVLLICLIPLYNAEYEKLFAFLQNDAARKFPCIQLIERILTDTFEERCQARDCFSSHMPLLKWQLINAGENAATGTFNPATPFVIDARIAAYLTGSALLDSKTEPYLKVINCQQSISELLLAEDLKTRLQHLIDYLQQPAANKSNHLLAFDGSAGSGKKQAAAVLAQGIGIPLLALRVASILTNLETFQNAIKRVLREVILVGAGLLIEDFDLLLGENPGLTPYREFLLEQIQQYCWLCFIISTKEFGRPDRVDEHRFIRFHFPIPDFNLRAKIWQRMLNERQVTGLSASSEELANRFKFNPSQIKNAIHSALDSAFSMAATDVTLTESDLLKGCWAQCNQKLSRLALKIESQSGWEDLVLPDEQLTLLQEVCSHFQYQSVVFSQWGFKDKIRYGQGLSVLFSGPSGTGKTMAAGIIARELKLELYKIDLSTIVSKYIGETEKNLARIFEEAETSNSILFFDEADALFGKRSEITNAHDRYANIETSYLLQKMEEYEGITILASNLRQNMDQAFMRRLQFIIEFPFPDQKLRERLWKGIFPAKAPLVSTIDYDFLSSRFKLSGGNIKNIAVNASFYAAEEHSEIQIRHIMLAAKREYTKLGMSFVKSDMAPYFELIEDGEQP